MIWYHVASIYIRKNIRNCGTHICGQPALLLRHVTTLNPFREITYLRFFANTGGKLQIQIWHDI